MLHVKKLRELGRGITGYIRSHLWVSIMGSLMLLFLLVVLIFQGYLKNGIRRALRGLQQLRQYAGTGAAGLRPDGNGQGTL